MSTYNPIRKVITGPETVFSYLFILEPRAASEGAPAKFSVSLIISKEDTVTIAKIKAAQQAAYEDGINILKGSGKVAPPFEKLNHIALRDGDEARPNDPAYRNAYFVNATCYDKPRIVDMYKRDITDPAEIYSGIVGRASINFYAYNRNGNKGIGCGLNSLQKLRDGTPLGGRSRPEDDFPDASDDEDFLA